MVRSTYLTIHGVAALRTMNITDEAGVPTLFNPIEFAPLNIMPTAQGSRILYNTVTMVMPILQQCLLLLIMNCVSHEFQIYSTIPIHMNGLARLLISLVYDLVGSLCMTGCIWAFRESWSVSATQFALSWMVLWLLFHTHFVLLDAATSFVSIPGIPLILLTWMILNLTRSLNPVEISPSFYRWASVLPAHETYTVLTDIWSSTGAPRLNRALVVLFCWWILSLCGAVCGHFRRGHEALIDEKISEDSSKSRPQRTHSESPCKSGRSTSLEVTPDGRLSQEQKVKMTDGVPMKRTTPTADS